MMQISDQKERKCRPLNTGDPAFAEAHSFKGVPYFERIVPFPNLNTILRQHLQLHPEAAALRDGDRVLTYRQLWHSSIRVSELMDNSGQSKTEPFVLPFPLDLDHLVTLLACLNSGRPVLLLPEGGTLQGSSRVSGGSRMSAFLFEEGLRQPFPEPDDSPIPFLDLGHSFFLIPKGPEAFLKYTAYNILAAAQSLGKALALFRPGPAFLRRSTRSLSELLISFLSPLYYGKEILLGEQDADRSLSAILRGDLHFAYHPEAVSIPAVGDTGPYSSLRDAALLLDNRCRQNSQTADTAGLPLRFIRSFELFSGMGLLYDSSGQELSVPGIESAVGDNACTLLRGPSLFHGALDRDLKPIEFTVEDDTGTQLCRSGWLCPGCPSPSSSHFS